MRTMKNQVGDQTALFGLICGPFTLALHLRGTEIFTDLIRRADLLMNCLNILLKFVTQWQIFIFKQEWM